MQLFVVLPFEIPLTAEQRVFDEVSAVERVAWSKIRSPGLFVSEDV